MQLINWGYAQFVHCNSFVKRTENINRLGKAVELAAEGTPLSPLIKTMRGMLYLPRAVEQGIQSTKKPTLSLGTVADSAVRGVALGLACLHVTKALLFLHQKGAVNLGAQFETMSTAASAMSISIGTIRIPLAIYSMVGINGKLGETADKAIDGVDRKIWEGARWTNLFIIGQMAPRLASDLMEWSGVKAPFGLAHTAAFFAICRGWSEIGQK